MSDAKRIKLEGRERPVIVTHSGTFHADEALAVRGERVGDEALGGQRIAPRGALADGLDHERGDGRFRFLDSLRDAPLN